MKNKILKKILVICSLVMVTLPLFDIKTVHAATSFTTCTLSENSYLRAEAGSDVKIKDVDGDLIVLSSPRRLEVIGSKVVDGKEYKKVSTNYYSSNFVGWIWIGYLTDFKTYTIDDSYGNKLRNLGFPEGYILPLQKLHAVYPNWNFIPSKNASVSDWNTVVNGENSPVYKNLIQISDKSLLSTDGAAYNAGVYTEFEPGWYAPSRQTVSFYMDPRNWLNDATIFMFEQLSYNSTAHTLNAVQQSLLGTFMAGTHIYNGKTYTYAETFVEAGKLRNVSPVHLATRVVQEQGSKGSATINMNGNDGNMYYNFFNINAYGDTTAQIVSNALTTAKARGWTTPYTSIIGGSETISNGYNNVGQDTIYYQKFNTINNNSLYSNQYMANVRVLPTESFRIYNSYYKSGLLNNNFTFKIPVYDNMPDATTLSSAENGENALRSLSVSGCNLNPEFNSAATSYTCNVPSKTKQVTITAEKASIYSSVEGDGVILLNNYSTTANIIVTAANGNKKTYKVTINKVYQSIESPADIISGLGYNNSNNIVSGIDLGTNAANIISNVKNKYSLATISISDKDNKTKSEGIIVTGDKITISNNGQTTTFTAIIKGDANGDGKISIGDFAKVKSHILKKETMTGIYLTASDVNGDGKVSIGDFAMIKSHILGKIKITK